MKKIFTLFFLVALILSILVSYSSAHPGRTDSKGGHYNRSTGEYHYHHGQPAHQHPGGICPYNDINLEKDQDDTEEDVEQIAPHPEESEKDRPSVWDALLDSFWASLFLFVPTSLVLMNLQEKIPEPTGLITSIIHFLCLFLVLFWALYYTPTVEAVILVAVIYYIITAIAYYILGKNSWWLIMSREERKAWRSGRPERQRAKRERRAQIRAERKKQPWKDRTWVIVVFSILYLPIAFGLTVFGCLAFLLLLIFFIEHPLIILSAIVLFFLFLWGWDFIKDRKVKRSARKSANREKRALARAERKKIPLKDRTWVHIILLVLLLLLVLFPKSLLLWAAIAFLGIWIFLDLLTK